MSDSAHELIVGVDGGGTGCRVAVGFVSKGVLAKAEGGRANVASDPDMAVSNILTAVKAAAAQLTIPADALMSATAHLGLAGVMTENDSARIAAQFPFARTIVTDDRPTALAGALGGQDGYLASVGTGTIIASSEGNVFRAVGGWGFQVSDQGSGAWVGRAALERVLMCHDGLEAHTDLTRSILGSFDDDPNAIVAFSQSAKPGDFGRFAPTIVAQATAGDPWGRMILSEGADYLLRGLSVLGLGGGEPICLAGGLGPHYAAYLPESFLKGRIAPKGTALDGAFQLALDHHTKLRSIKR